MSRDFAQRGNGGRQVAGGAPGWLWLFIGIALGAAGAAGYYISRPMAGGGAEAGAAADKDKPGAHKKITIPPEKPSRFAFYELLPNYEVVVPRESVKPASPAAAPATGERFLIQVGSFKDRGEADQQKAKLALLGIESRVEKVTIDNATTWYRVRIGPAERARVDAMLSQLEANGVSALVMQLPPGAAR